MRLQQQEAISICQSLAQQSKKISGSHGLLSACHQEKKHTPHHGSLPTREPPSVFGRRGIRVILDAVHELGRDEVGASRILELVPQIQEELLLLGDATPCHLLVAVHNTSRIS